MSDAETAPTPNYADLVAALAQERPEYRHLVCLKPALHVAVADAKRALGKSTIEKVAAEAAGATPRRKHGHIAPVDQAQRDLAAAEAERDKFTVAFILVPPTADEERAVIEQIGHRGNVYEHEMQRVTLLAGWQRTETLDGQPLDSLTRKDYTAVLSVATTEELARAHSDLKRVAIRPDFS